MQSRQGLAEGVEVDGYRIDGVLGRGGMGIVYRAEDIALSRTVALKVIDPALARDEAFIRRFRSEARALARINSSHIVSIHALRQTEAGMFIVMEYVDGGTLADVLNKGPVAWEDAYPLIRQMLLALEQAHGVGVIHRDIKPGNIMLSTAGEVKVTDFGLAKVSEANRASTVTQGVAGTLYYMSPEQVKGRLDLDHRSDLYALGMTLYEMLAGRLPFSKDASDFAIMRTIVEKDLPSPSRLNEQVPEPVAEVIMRALQKEADDRFADAREMREAFERAAGASPSRAGRGNQASQQDATASSTTYRKAALLAAVVLIAALLGAGGYWWYGGSAFIGGGPDEYAAYPAGQLIEEAPVDAHMLDGELLAERMQEPPAAGAASPEGSEPELRETPRPATPTRDGRPDAPTEASSVALATLRLQAADDGVRITAGGVTRTGAAQFQLRPGTHTVVFEHPTYGEREERIALEEGADQSMTYFFTGEVNILSTMTGDGATGPWAKIWVDGDTQDDWFTDKKITLGPGPHTITLTRAGYEVLDNNQEVTITPGFHASEHSVIFHLRRE